MICAKPLTICIGELFGIAEPVAERVTYPSKRVSALSSSSTAWNVTWTTSLVHTLESSKVILILVEIIGVALAVILKLPSEIEGSELEAVITDAPATESVYRKSADDDPLSIITVVSSNEAEPELELKLTSFDPEIISTSDAFNLVTVQFISVPTVNVGAIQLTANLVTGKLESISKDGIVRSTLGLPAESVTIIVQSE